MTGEPEAGVGAIALTRLSKEVLQVVVGVAVMAAAAWQMRRRQRGVEPHQVSAGVAGFTSGALTTSINVSGPPIVLWLEARGAPPEEFRASLAATFVALDVAGGALLLGAEGSASVDVGTVAPLLGMVIAGYALGAVAFRRLNRERFYTLVLALVACTGAASVAAGLGVF